MTILIVSIDHKIQLIEHPNDKPARRKLKFALRSLVNATIATHIVSAIFEESLPKKMTIARQIADQTVPKIDWESIIMTDNERKAESILEALDKRPWRPNPQNTNERIEKRIPEDQVREDFFIRQILKAENAAGDVLVLLGDMHVMAVANKLRAMGHTVLTRHELVPDKRWEL